MADYALLDEYNNVLNVIAVADEDDSKGEQWVCARLCEMHGGIWKKTTRVPDPELPKNFAAIGGVYDVDKNAFIYPKPAPYMVLDNATCQWVYPTPYPEDGREYDWDEDTLSWIALETAQPE